MNEEYKDPITSAIGSFGKYQILVCFTVFVSKFPVAFHQLGIFFLAPNVKYFCLTTKNASCPCDHPSYDRSVFTRTMIMEWDLICRRHWLSSFSQTLFKFGTLIGSLAFGIMADRCGRKNAFLGSTILNMSMGITAAFMKNFWMFTFIRLLIGGSIGGILIVGFVILMEFVGKQYRDMVSAIFHIVYFIGYMLLPVFGYYFRDFSYFQLAVSLPGIVMICYFFALKESPRWLMVRNKTDEAVRILEKIAQMNNRPTRNIKFQLQAYQQLTIEQEVQRQGNIIDLFRTPNLRKHIIGMAFCWFACGYCFFGVTQFAAQLSGNIFVNVEITACVCFVAALFCFPLMKCVGRKTIFLVMNASCAVSLVLVAVMPEGPVAVGFATVGVAASMYILMVAYIYCSEMFPTVVRNSALGFCSMMARVGSMIAPFMINLGVFGRWTPPVAFATLPLIASFVCLILPETKGCDLMTTLEQGENFGAAGAARKNKISPVRIHSGFYPD